MGERRRNPFPPPVPRRAPLPFYLDTSTQTDILVVQAFDSAVHLKNLCPVDTYYRNQLRHPLNRGLSNNWALGKEGCSGAKSPVNRNNLTPSLECGPLDVMFEVLSTRYQPLRLYFCISNVMHNRYKHA